VRTARESIDLQGIATQARDHLACVDALFGGETPPGVAQLKQAVGATRALRGSASLLGLDPFQAFLGRLLQLLEDAETGTVPWSARIELAVRDLRAAETGYVHDLDRGDPHTASASFERPEPPVAPAAPSPVALPLSGGSGAPSASITPLAAEIDIVAQAVQHLRQSLPVHGVPPAGEAALATLAREIAMLDAWFRAPRGEVREGAETTQEGLRNHCEGALHHLVEAAAQEVLDEARERGLRLALRVTGALDPIDEPLGAALLEILAHLWSDCLDVQAARGETRIDTVVRCAEHRAVVEIRDDGARDDAWRAARSDDDVLGRYPGLRRSRPLVEELGGLVEVEPPQRPGCRFRLTLPLATERPHVAIIRVGQHDVALPASAVDGVHDAGQVRAAQDAAGPFVEVDGARVPVLHLAFLLGDVSFDELEREHVVVVGSFERRAALFASNARRTAVGSLHAAPQGLWAGAVETDSGVCPMLHVGALLGRCTPAVAPAAGSPPVTSSAAHRDPGLVLVVDSAALERDRIAELLGADGYTVHAVQTADEAWGLLESVPVGLLLCDLRLPEMNAQQIAERRQHTGRHGGVPLVLILVHAGEQSHLVVQQLGATSWVRSPVEPENLLENVGQHVVRKSQVRIES
jgi:CheY-like chemotaxis protein